MKTLKGRGPQEMNTIIDVIFIKKEILRQYGTINAYAQKFNLNKSAISMFLSHYRPATFRQLLCHANNLKLKIILSLQE